LVRFLETTVTGSDDLGTRTPDELQSLKPAQPSQAYVTDAHVTELRCDPFLLSS
jgi:hypothetical protein